MRRICIYLSIVPVSRLASKARAGSNTLNPRRAALPSEPLVTPQLISPPTNQPTNFSGCSLLLSLTAQPLPAHSSSSADVSSNSNLSPRKEKKRDEDDKADYPYLAERRGSSSNRYPQHQQSHSRSVRDDEYGDACHVTYHDRRWDRVVEEE